MGMVNTQTNFVRISKEACSVEPMTPDVDKCRSVLGGSQ